MTFIAPQKKCVGKRHIFALIAHFACFMVYTQRFNFSVTLVAMVKERSSISPSINLECMDRQHYNSSKAKLPIKDTGEFTWNEKEQGILKSAFFHGYTSALLVGGLVSSRWSGKWVFATGIFMSSSLTLFVPIAARTNYYLLYVARLFIGIIQGLSVPAIQEVLKEWAPLNEKTRLSAVVYSGSETGSVAALFLGGVLCSYWGWPSLSYVLGVAGILLSAIWLNFVSDSPHEHPSISKEEKEYIIDSQYDAERSSNVMESPKIPWYDILTSGPVWAISIAKFVHNWVYYLAINDMPSYFKDVLNMSTLENGFNSGMPFLFSFFTQIVGSIVSDLLIKREYSVTMTRKFITSLGFSLSAFLLCLVGYIGCDNRWLSVMSIIFLVGLSNFSYCGYGVNQLDISPRYAGVIWSINTFIGNISGMVTNLLTGYITNNHPTRYYYRIAFMIAAGVSMFGVAIYCVFAEGTEQAWNRIDGKEGDDDTAEANMEQHTPLLRSK